MLSILQQFPIFRRPDTIFYCNVVLFCSPLISLLFCVRFLISLVPGDMSSLNAGSAFISSSLILTLFMLQLQQMFISHLSKVSQISTSTAATSRNTEANGQHRTRTTATRTKSSSATTTRKSKCCNSCRTSDTTHVLDYSRRTNDTIPDSYHSLLLKKQQHCSYVRMGASGATALCMDLTNS